MKTNGMIKNLVSATLLASTIFGASVSRAGEDAQREHGAVLTDAPSIRAIAEGPIDLRAYPRVKLGTVFLVDAAGNGDQACRAGLGKNAGVDLVANRRIEIEVPAGKVACVAVTKPGLQELLWKARRSPPLLAAR